MKACFGFLWKIAVVCILTAGLFGCETSSSDGDDEGSIDPKVVGTWKVVSDWRWSEMTFNANGTKSQVDRLSGERNNRGSWSAKDGKLIVVSDVIEEWPYTVTASALVFTTPGGTRVQMMRK